MNRSNEIRVMVTGVGIVCALGNNYTDVIKALGSGKSGITSTPEWQQYGISSLISGKSSIDENTALNSVSTELRYCMSETVKFCASAALDAVADAGIDKSLLQNNKAACIISNGDSNTAGWLKSAELAFQGKSRQISPFTLLQGMSNNASATLASMLGIRGPSFSISAACASSAHAIGQAFWLIKSGMIDVAVVGGGEAINEIIAAGFEGMRNVLSTKFNSTPQKASRPFDKDRDGLVLSGGAGVIILESEEHAARRGARARAEIIGYGATSDGYSLVSPLTDGAEAANCMSLAMENAGIPKEAINYINTHGTSTVAGDRAETMAFRKVFGTSIPPFSSTKSMTGHSLSAAGVHEVIFCIGMLEDGFMAPSINIDNIEKDFEDLPIIRSTVFEKPKIIMSNNFGFGGTNASLVLQQADQKN